MSAKDTPKGVEYVVMFWLLVMLPLSNLYMALGPFYLNPSEALVIVLFILLACRRVLRGGAVRWPRSLRIMGFCAFGMAITLVLIGFATANLAVAVRLAFSVLFAFLLAVVSFRYGPDAWVKPIMIGVTISIVIAFGHLTGLVPLFEFERETSGIATSGLLEVGYTGLVSARGEYGILLLLGLAAAMIGLTARFKWLFFVAVMVAGLITISRSTWLALALATLIMAILFALPGKALAGRVKNLLFLIVALAVLSVPAFLLGFFGWVQERFDLLVNLRVSSFDNRLRQFSNFFSNADEYFWLGGGSSDFIAAFGYSIHNTQMAVYLAFGVLPALFYSVLFIGAISKAVTCVATIRDGAAKKQAATLLAAMLGCFIEASLYPKVSSMIMWALIGITWGHIAYLQRTHAQPPRGKRAGVSAHPDPQGYLHG